VKLSDSRSQLDVPIADLTAPLPEDNANISDFSVL
jgi:hypothetical protein